MGCSRERIHRALADTAAPVISHHDAPWTLFITEHDLGKVSIGSYYNVTPLAGANGSPKFSSEQREELLKNLFADAVGLGSITLPQDIAAEDFELRLYLSDEERLEVRSRVHEHAVADAVSGDVEWMLRPQLRMGDSELRYLLSYIAAAASECVRG